MTLTKSIQISSKEVKTAMKSLGIKVLRASQNKMGVLITVAGDFKNQERVLNYFNENSMSISPSITIGFTKKECEYVDYGTIFKWEIL